MYVVINLYTGSYKTTNYRLERGNTNLDYILHLGYEGSGLFGFGSVRLGAGSESIKDRGGGLSWRLHRRRGLCEDFVTRLAPLLLATGRCAGDTAGSAKVGVATMRDAPRSYIIRTVIKSRLK